MSVGGLLLVALGIAVGMIGIVVPMIPGTALVVAAIGIWALVDPSPKAWVVLGIAVAIAIATTVAKYVWPAQRMRQAGVPTVSLVIGAVAGIIGFFVVPVLGLAIGFVVGIFLAELIHRSSRQQAWASTVTAVKAVATSIGIEMVGAMVSAGIWLGAVLT